MRIYISGAISGKSDARIRFDVAEKELRERYPFAVIVNPEKVMRPLDDQKGLAARLIHEEYMEISFALMQACNHIYMIDGWQESKGACREYGYAKALNMEFIGKRREK